MSPIFKITRNVICLSLTGFIFNFATPVHAGDGDDEQLIRNIHDQLVKAEAATTPADQQEILESAYKGLKDLPPDGKRNGKRYKKAEGFIRSAIDQIKSGDPDHTANHFIEDADSIVRDAEK